MAKLTQPPGSDGQALLHLTTRVLDRALGAANSPNLRVFAEDLAERRLFFGRLVHAGRTMSGSEYTSKNAPCAYIARLRLRHSDPFVLRVTPSFNVYVHTGLPKGADGRPSNAGVAVASINADPADESPDAGRVDMWTPWPQRMRPPTAEYLSMLSSIAAPGGSRDRLLGRYTRDRAVEAQIRKRYAQDCTVTLAGEDEARIDLDLPAFRAHAAAPLGPCAHWAGRIVVRRTPAEDGSEITVTLTNTVDTARPLYDPRWYDVHLRIGWEAGALVPTPCPILREAEIAVETLNCSANVETGGHSVVLGPIARTQTAREQSRSTASFAAVAEDPGAGIEQLIGEIVPYLTSGAADALPADAEAVLSSVDARSAIQSVSRVFDRATGGGSWYAHQLAALVYGAAKYLRGEQAGNYPEHLVLNVPTAGGKTEAFLALCLFASFYHLAQGRRAVSIVKYPMTLLSRDQVARLAGYVMVADEIALEQQPRSTGIGIGYHVGRKDSQQGAHEILDTCPYPDSANAETGRCGATWRERTIVQGGIPETQCTVGHILRMSVDRGEQIVQHCPGILVSTWDKWAAQSGSRRLGLLLGARRYYCPAHGYLDARDAGHARAPGRKSTLSKVCQVDGCGRRTHNVGAVIPGALVYDEAHLIREATGSLDSHFETTLLEVVKGNSGRYPLAVVSTATIARVEHHLWQLGLISEHGAADVLPGPDVMSAFFERLPDALKHDVIGLLPVDTVINRALPELIDTFFETLLEDYGYDVTDSAQKDDTPPNLPQVRQVMVYTSSYQNIYGLREMNANAIASQRERRGRAPLRETQLSRRYIDETSLNAAVEAVREARYPIVYATNLASVGIDIGTLDIIFFYGLPANVAEFIQAMNRTGRRRPAVCLAVLGPAKEREMSYYRYWEPFIHNLDAVIEPVPLNRFAFNAIDKTFNNVATSVILHQIVHGKGVHLWRNTDILWALGSQERVIEETKLLDELARIYREDEDPSDVYREKLRERWEAYNAALEDAERPAFVAEVLQQRGPNGWLFGLRGTDRTVELAYADAFDTVKRRSEHSTLAADEESDAFFVANPEQDRLDGPDEAEGGAA